MRRILLLCWALFSTQFIYAQNDLTFYHMGSYAPQSTLYNPVFFPDAKIYISLPIVSGVNLAFDSPYNYGDLFKNIEGSDSVRIDVQGLLNSIQDGDQTNFVGSISLFQFGWSINEKSAVHLFANERLDFRLIYPKQLLQYMWDGNGEYLGTPVTENDLGAYGNHYREYGVGYSHELIVLGNKTLRVGARVKYLQGILQVETDQNASATLLTNENDFGLTIEFNNPIIRTTGLEKLENIDEESSYFISNGNTGVGFDIGAEMALTDKLDVAVAVNDIGAINWKEGVKNYQLVNDLVEFGGLNLKDLDDVGQVLQDTLEVLFEDETFTDSYQTKLPMRTFLGGSYQVIKNGQVKASMSMLSLAGRNYLDYGIGYTHKFGKVLTLSGSLTKKQNQTLSFGGGFGIRLGSIQLYSMVDNLGGYTDVRKTQDITMRMGLNFVFGRKGKRYGKEKKNKHPKHGHLEDGPFPPGYGTGHLDSLKADSLRHHGIEPDSTHFEPDGLDRLELGSASSDLIATPQPDKVEMYARRKTMLTAWRDEYD